MIKRFPAFQQLRTMPWDPSFRWVSSQEETADQINRWHEDYPARVERTLQAIRHPETWGLDLRGPNTGQLLDLHRLMFGDTAHGGEFRQQEVMVLLHRPPRAEILRKLMRELEERYRGEINNLENLYAWYQDFEAIHPLLDGNGRVGGVVAAVYSHMLEPEKGWWAPGH